MNGSDTSTTFTDDSLSAHSFTAVGNAQIDTADKKYGSASGLFDGTGDYIYTAYVASFDWFSADHTIELWVKAASWAGWENPAGQSAAIGRMDVSGPSVYWSFGPRDDGKVIFYYYNGSAQTVVSTGALSTGAWHHIAMTHIAGTGAIKIWIDGVLDGSGTKAGTPQSATYQMILGQANSNCITGWLDDVRITSGSARYTGTFTPPIAEHPDV
jgi:hypothetical protein